jgi:hypothetical protein
MEDRGALSDLRVFCRFAENPPANLRCLGRLGRVRLICGNMVTEEN